jgi:ankyrin repeat protein
MAKSLLALSLTVLSCQLLAMNEDDVHVRAQEFFSAVESDNILKVKLFLETKFNVETKDAARANRSAIHFANSKAMLRLLLAYGAKINVQDTDGMTALHLKVWYADYELAYYLLFKGANKCIRNNYGHSVLSYSTDEIDPELANALRPSSYCLCKHCKPSKQTKKSRNELWHQKH